MYLNALECCGIGELNGVGDATLDEILAGILEAQGEKNGMVIATSIGAQRSVPSKLEKLSFRKIEKFRNPNTGNTVTMWLRSTKMTDDEVTRANAWIEADKDHSGRPFRW